MGWNREPASSSVPENDMTGAMLIVIDAQAACDNLQILNPLIARIQLHFCCFPAKKSPAIHSELLQSSPAYLRRKR